MAHPIRKEMGTAELGYVEGPDRGSDRPEAWVLVIQLEHDVPQFAI